MRIVLVGPPGVGKGTQAALIQERLGAVVLSSGAIFRKEIDAETDLGRLANSYIKRGELVPSGITIEMMAKRIRSDEVRKHGFVLDGFPRSTRQAEALAEVLADMDQNLDEVVSLEIREERVIARLSGRIGCTICGEIYHSVTKPPRRPDLCDKCDGPLFSREDDKPATIKERLRVFRESTEPVLSYYDLAGIVRRVNADQSPEEVYADIVAGFEIATP